MKEVRQREMPRIEYLQRIRAWCYCEYKATLRDHDERLPRPEKWDVAFVVIKSAGKKYVDWGIRGGERWKDDTRDGMVVLGSPRNNLDPSELTVVFTSWNKQFRIDTRAEVYGRQKRRQEYADRSNKRKFKKGI